MADDRPHRRRGRPVAACDLVSARATAETYLEPNNFNILGTPKYVYADEDVKEYPPQGLAAPIFQVPSEDAPNAIVKQYLLAVFTRTGWGIAIESSREVRATINKFVGNGWALRNKYAKNDLKEICPTSMGISGEDGVLQTHKISNSTRQNIAKCVKREMERYFEAERGRQYEERYTCDGDQVPVLKCANDGFFTALHHEKGADKHILHLPRRPQSRATLPDEWLTERTRARQASRLSQYPKDESATGAPEALPLNGSSIFVSRISAYPLITDITTIPTRRNSVTGSNHDSMMEKDRQPERTVSDTRPSTSLGKSSASPFHSLQGSSLPRPTTPFGTKRFYRATIHFEPSIQQGAPPPDRDSAASVEARPTSWIEVEPQSLPEDHVPEEDSARDPTAIEDDVTNGEIDANEENHANEETRANEENHANDEEPATSDATLAPHIEESDNAIDVAETPVLQIQTTSDDSSSTKDASEAAAVTRLKHRSDPLPRTNPSVEEWLRRMPTPRTPAVMTTLSIITSDERGVKDPSLIRAIPFNTNEGKEAVYPGSLSEVNDIPAGRQSENPEVSPAEDEIQEARRSSLEPTAERQKLVLDKDKGTRQEKRLKKKKRYFLKRLWRRLRGRSTSSAVGGQ